MFKGAKFHSLIEKTMTPSFVLVWKKCRFKKDFDLQLSHWNVTIVTYIMLINMHVYKSLFKGYKLLPPHWKKTSKFSLPTTLQTVYGPPTVKSRTMETSK